MTMLYLVGSNKDCNDSEQKQRKYDRRGKRKGIVQWDKGKAPGRSTIPLTTQYKPFVGVTYTVWLVVSRMAIVTCQMPDDCEC